MYQIIIFALILFYYGPIIFGTVLMSYSGNDGDSDLDGRVGNTLLDKIEEKEDLP